MYIKKKRKKENVFFKQKFAQHEKIRFMISKSLIWNIITLMNSSLIYILRLFNSFIMRIKLTLIFILLSSKRNEIFHNRHVSKIFLFKRKISTKIISLFTNFPQILIFHAHSTTFSPTFFYSRPRIARTFAPSANIKDFVKHIGHNVRVQPRQISPRGYYLRRFLRKKVRRVRWTCSLRPPNPFKRD